MRALRALLALALLMLALVGCSGEGEGTNAPLLYEGNWTGTWSSPTLSQTGTISALIPTNGELEDGQFSIDQFGRSGDLEGTVDSSGELIWTADFGEDGAYVLEGSMTVTTDRRLRGTFMIRTNGESYPATFELSSGG
jgi:hypothetical protein